MHQSEPPSTQPAQNIFLVGRDSHGHWVVQDERGLCGGLFVDRNEAIRYAMDETGKQPQAIRLVPGVFELDMSRPAPNPSRRSASPPSSDFHGARAQTAVNPPSTSKSDPVTKLDASLARNNAARAISSGDASRLSRCFGPSAARAAAMSLNR